ncbi:MAG TPA: hypothetical protein VFA59_20440 [Vicinamibacterales bacterium]|nr:hypothetical protein [Vicinamibacterales bacterium]
MLPQLPGFRGIAFVDTAGQGALIAVKHMLPLNVLLLLSAD